MLKITDNPIAPDATREAQAVIVTSAHGARRLGELVPAPKRVFAVGGATAQIARGAGSWSVTVADGDVQALAATVISALRPSDEPVAHLRGEDTAGDLSGALVAAGFRVLDVVAYQAEIEAEFSPNAAEALRDRGGAVLFHSARGCAAFMAAVERQGLADRLENWLAISLSSAAGAPAQAAAFGSLDAAERPDEDSLMTTLIRVMHAGS